MRRRAFSRRRARFETLEGRRLLAGVSDDTVAAIETIEVTVAADISDPDDDQISLREAVQWANERTVPVTITFNRSLDRQTILLSQAGDGSGSGDLDLVSGSIRIKGNGTSRTIVSAGGDTGIGDRVFQIQGSQDVVFEGLTIRDGRAEHGAGILHQGPGSLTIRDVWLTNNVATNTGGALAVFAGSVAVDSAMIEHNAAAFGGGIGNLSTLTVTASTLSENSAIEMGGGVFSSDRFATTAIMSSTFSGNEGIGGGLANLNSATDISNSTFSGNTSRLAGAILNIAQASRIASVSILASTITGNQSGETASVHTVAQHGDSSAPLSYGSTIFVENVSDVDTPRNLSRSNEQGTGAVLISTGHNLLDDFGSGTLIATDIGGVDVQATPVIAPLLAYNGGPTNTHALLYGSPAIDAGVASEDALDQRGVKRPIGKADIGAYERDTPALFLNTDKYSGEQGSIDEGSSYALLVWVAAFDQSDVSAADPISVQLNVSGTDFSEDDFELSTDTVFIPQGQGFETVILSAIDDDLVESRVETARLQLVNASGATTSGKTHKLLIYDNDSAEISVSGATVHPFDRQADFTVRLSQAVDVPIVAQFSTQDRSAVAGVDYVGITDQQVIIPAGTTSTTVSVVLSSQAKSDRTFGGEVRLLETSDRDVRHASVLASESNVPAEQITESSLSADGSIAVYLATSYWGDLASYYGQLYSSPTDSSGPPRNLGGDLFSNGGVLDYQLAANGQRVIFRAREGPESSLDLYSVPTDGSSPPVRLHQRLHQRLALSREAQTYKISADGSRVVFKAALKSRRVELYSVPADGSGEPQKIDAPWTRHHDLWEFALSADGNTVVYSALTADERSGALFSVSVDGSSPPIELDGERGSNRQRMTLTPDGSRVIYSFNRGLYSVPTDGSEMPVQLHEGGISPFGYAFNLEDLEISADSSRVIYQFEAEFGSTELFSVPSDGSTPAVNLTALAGVTGFMDGFSLDRDGRHVVIRNSDDELYFLATDGSAPATKLKLHEETTTVYDFSLTPDGQRLVYIGNFGNRGRGAVFSIPTDGASPPVKLSLSLTRYSYDSIHAFTLSADGSQVVYQTTSRDPELYTMHDDVFEFYSVPVDGASTAVSLTGPQSQIGEVVDVALSADGQRLIYRSIRNPYNATELYTTPTDGSSEPVKLNHSLRRSSRVWHFRRVENRIVYSAYSGIADRTELYSALIDGGMSSVRLNAPIPWDGRISGWGITPDGSRVWYYVRPGARHDVTQQDESYGLFTVPADGSAEPQRRTFPNPPSSFGIRVKVTSDGRHFVGSNFGSQLFSFPVDDPSGQAGQQWFVPNLNYTQIEIDDVSQSIVYEETSHYIHTPNALFSVPIDGSATPVKLNMPLASGDSIGWWSKPPESNRVFFSVIRDVDAKLELYSVPADGSAAATKFGELNRLRPLFRLSADGQYLLVLSDLETPSVTELFGLRTDGTSNLRKLNDTLTADGDVASDFQFTADGSRVVYRADKSSKGIFELFSVPVEGLSSPTHLNSVHIHPTGAKDFLISPDGRRVVYRGWQDDYNKQELFSVPTDGSAAPVKLSMPLTDSQDVRADYTISPDGTQVAYLLDDSDSTTTRDLFSVPIDGATSSLKINPALRGNEKVGSYRFSPSSEQVIYTFGGRMLIADLTAQAVATITDHEPGSETAPVVTLPLSDAVDLSVDGSDVVIANASGELFRGEAEGIDELRVYATAGDDTVNLTELHGPFGGVLIINAGPGNDVLRLASQSQELDLTSSTSDIFSHTFRNFETIDVSAGGTLTITSDSIVAMQPETKRVTVIRGAAGTLLLPERWVASKPQWIHGVLHHRATHGVGTETVELLVAGPNAWHNPFEPHDTDGDGDVFPTDALQVINALNRSRESHIAVPQLVPNADLPEMFLDVSGDGVVDPYDALLVINRLNHNRREENRQGDAGAFADPASSMDLSWTWEGKRSERQAETHPGIHITDDRYLAP